MSADDENGLDGNKGQIGSGSTDPRLEALRQKLDAEKKTKVKAPGGLTAEASSGMAQALKLSSEFVAGIIVGFVIGYTIDRFVGTTPWGLIIFVLLGFAAGTLNVMRATGVVAEKLPRDPKGPK